MKFIATLIFFLMPIVASGQSANRDSLDEAISLAKENAFYASRVDWKNIEEEATRLLLSPEGGEDAAITYVARSLGDGHSFYSPKRPDSAIKQSAPPKTRPPIAVFEGLDGSVPIISINSWSGGGPDMPAATKRVRTALERAIALNSCGLILDFSENGGGNMWPMASGLIPLLSEGVLGYFRDRDGNDVSIERSKDRILIADQPLGSYGGRAEEITAPKRIAIIIGPNSISSGEIVPILRRPPAFSSGAV